MIDDSPHTVTVRAGGGRSDYEVIVREGVLEELPRLLEGRVPAFRYAVIADATVADLYGEGVVEGLSTAGLRADLYRFPAGERHKTRASWADLTDDLLGNGHGRDSVVVALGGGVTGDLAGFVAATFLRGVPVVQVPTSVVAMVDASVGGKTGVDASAGKNLVGAFHPPRLVVADPATIRTLPRAERAGGFAEAVKHGAILDRSYLDRLVAQSARLLEGEPGALRDAARRSVELKAEVVSRDEREEGLREILNFGHTLGHALEASSGYALSHGAAVALGMVLEARLGERVGVTAKGTAETLADAVARFELPADRGGLDFTAGLPDADRLIAFTRVDKKGRGGQPRYVLLEEPGAVASGRDGWSREVPPEAVEEVLREALGSP